MKHKSVKRYSFKHHDKLFLDANIWLLLYGPQKPQGNWVKIYSQVFQRILKAGSKIYTDVLVVSEFINRYARIKHELVAPCSKFKDFRKSPDFKPVAQDTAADVKKNILKHCRLIESGFSTVGMDDLLDEYAAGESDFNDQVITELCKTNGLTLITNDADFKCKDIPILTANNRLLKRLTNS